MLPRPQQRARLKTLRLALPERAVSDANLAQHLARLLQQLQPQCVAGYWPLAGEFDPRPVLAAWLEFTDGRRETPSGKPAIRHVALPEVVAPEQPLRFLAWSPDTPMRAGAYGIPVPAQADVLKPDLLLLPCVGYSREADGRFYRLGYGGGFYDRTLAQCAEQGGFIPVAVGLAYTATRLDSLQPQPHDMPLAWLITENGVA